MYCSHWALRVVVYGVVFKREHLVEPIDSSSTFIKVGACGMSLITPANIFVIFVTRCHA